MGENPNDVFNVGCPRMDLICDELKQSVDLNPLFDAYKGVGPSLDLTEPFLLVSQHPVTTEFGSNRQQIEETLSALASLAMPTVMLWPNVDAGSDDISKGIRTFREARRPEWLHVFKNLPTPVYIQLMNATACLIGNSSSGIREATFIGTPVVNIGTRQHRRVRGENIVDVPYDSQAILTAIQNQIQHGKYPSNALYGTGDAGKKIANILATHSVPVQKTIAY